MSTRGLSDQHQLWDVGSISRGPTVPSLIKWTGSKRSLAARINSFFPPYKRYVEPFLGGGSLLYLSSVPGSLASDVYGPLIGLWRLLRDSPALVIENYKHQWELLQRELDTLEPSALPVGETLPRYYYEVRERFNKQFDPLDLNFILRTCVNGIVRFNDDGRFNNSFHLSRRGMTPSRFAHAVRAWSPALAGVELMCCDYAETLSQTREGDVVYLDPPYANSKNRYAEDLNLERLLTELERLNSRSVSWLLSFDGSRGDTNLLQEVPRELYQRHELLSGGLSAVKRVLSGPLEEVHESLYMNF